MFYLLHGDRCQVCDKKATVEDHCGLLHGWYAADPVCGHSPIFLCQACRKADESGEAKACKRCGERMVYA